MPLRTMLILGSLITTAATGGIFVAQADDDADRMRLSVRVFENKKNPTIHAQSTVQVGIDKDFATFSGGKMGGESGSIPLEFGTRITGRITHIPRNSYQAVLRIEFSHQYSLRKKSPDVICGEFVTLRAELNSGASRLIQCGEDRWCELRLE